jgi:nitrite reductase/ring-hydroxylating ferredoxin subunit
MPDSSNNQPGYARAPGPSVADTLAADKIPGPAPLLERRYPFLGDGDISTSRYTSREWFDLEIDKLWPRTWQWACREEHLPDVGDNYVYEVGPYSVIVVRSSEDTIQAFLNSCTHRGTKILANAGTGYNPAFTCPFHGWSWELNGQVKNIPGRWDFPHVSDASHGLQPVLCERWGGFIFINMDLDAAPLKEYLDVLPEHFAHFPLENRHTTVHVEKILPANWKAAQEAFMEAYHNFETHNSPTGANAQYDLFGKYVSRFIHNLGKYSTEALADYPGDKWRDPVLTETEQMLDSGFATADVLEGVADENARAVTAQALRENLGQAMGVDLSKFSDSLMLDSIEYHLFPNMFFFPGISIPMTYRFRPNGDNVDECIFDLLILQPHAQGEEPPAPPEPDKLNVEQSYTEVEALKWLGSVYDEDTGNLAAQQQGFKTSRKQGITLGNYQEGRIRRVHLTLDEFLLHGAVDD